MSIILAYKHNNEVLVACDSAGTSGNFIFAYHKDDAKIFVRNIRNEAISVIFGVGSHKLNNILRNLDLPDKKFNQCWNKWLYEFLKLLEVEVSSGKIEMSNFLLVAEGRIFQIWNNYSFTTHDAFVAIGSANQIAYGAYWSLFVRSEVVNIKHHLRDVLKACETYDNRVREPFYLMVDKYNTVDEL